MEGWGNCREGLLCRFLSLDSLYLGGQPYPPLDEAIDWLGEDFLAGCNKKRRRTCKSG
jgi:hypothetical protein